MNELFFTAILAAATPAAGPPPQPPCAGEVRAAAIVTRLSELPPDIRDDLQHLSQNAMGDRDSPLLQTDAPVGAERDFPQTRFVQALFVDGKWFVQFEVAMFSGVRTIGYVRDGKGDFHRSPSHYFGGPACASIKAALDGVTTPGGFNF